MGQQFAKTPGPNDIVVLQQGGGHNCQCGPPTFDVHQVANDLRILNMGIAVEEIQLKLNGFATEMQARCRNPICYIYPGLVVGLIITIFFQTSFLWTKDETIEIFRMTGGLWVFLCIIPGLIKMWKARTMLMTFSKEYFQDWISRGLLVDVTYFPGAKHAQPSLTLHLPPPPQNVVGAAVVIPATAVVVPPTTSGVSGVGVVGGGKDGSSGLVSGVPTPVPVPAANNGTNQVVPIQSLSPGV